MKIDLSGKAALITGAGSGPHLRTLDVVTRSLHEPGMNAKTLKENAHE